MAVLAEVCAAICRRYGDRFCRWYCGRLATNEINVYDHGKLSMSESISERTRKCADCGHEWVKTQGAPDPARCPNHACRSKKWKGEVEVKTK